LRDTTQLSVASSPITVKSEADRHDGVDQEMGAEVPAKIGYLAIDTVDPNDLAPFWCGLLGVQVDTTIGAGEFVILSPTEDGLTVGFQRVPEAKTGKDGVHLDLVVEDLDAATAEVEQLGGRWLEPARHESLKDSGGVAWQTLKTTNSISMSSLTRSTIPQ
jgi:predicted enzyme related to lactoylglutathione lyase